MGYFGVSIDETFPPALLELEEGLHHFGQATSSPEHRILITINLLIIRLIPYKNQFPQIDFGENEINLKKAKFAAHIQYKNAYF